MKQAPTRGWTAQSIWKVQSAGGPREGKGGAVAEAMCAAAMGCRAWDKGGGLTVAAATGAGGNAKLMHKGQSMLALAGWA